MARTGSINRQCSPEPRRAALPAEPKTVPEQRGCGRLPRASHVSQREAVPESRLPENRIGSEEEASKPVALTASSPAPAAVTYSCNPDRFLEFTTPSVPARCLSKTRMKGWRTCDGEFRLYFTLGVVQGAECVRGRCPSGSRGKC